MISKKVSFYQTAYNNLYANPGAESHVSVYRSDQKSVQKALFRR